MSIWWTCPQCFDRMAESDDPRHVERDRDAHLHHNHQGATLPGRLLIPSHWTTTGEQAVTV